MGLLTITVVTVCATTVSGLARPSSADPISDAKAKAAAIEAELTQAQNQMSALSEQYDKAVYELSQVRTNIAATQTKIAADQRQVAADKKILSKAAVANYISNGTAASANPLFSGNNKMLAALTQYNAIATGDLNLAVDNLHAAQASLSAQEAQLQSEQSQAQAQVATQQNAVAQNQRAIAEQKDALSQEQGQIAQLVQQQQQAEAAAAAKATQQRLAAAAAAAAAAAQSRPTTHAPAGSASSSPAAPAQAPPVAAAPPPTEPGGAGAVQAAESQVGVPYVWGAESPAGSPNPGFDCSGLTAWSWGQVGVSLVHYSGAQMAESTPVPISDLQPGDLLFYGPGGSEHEAMYVGPGTMIEAPHTGANVRITALRLGDGFVGAGRP